MKIENVVAGVRAEVELLRNPPLHRCATFCYCGGRPTRQDEMERMRQRLDYLERTLRAAVECDP